LLSVTFHPAVFFVRFVVFVFNFLLSPIRQALSETA
jgi:hypothetical protein